MKLNYLGKSAIVTGSSGGMGLDISERLSNNKSANMLFLFSSKKK